MPTDHEIDAVARVICDQHSIDQDAEGKVTWDGGSFRVPAGEKAWMLFRESAIEVLEAAEAARAPSNGTGKINTASIPAA